MGFNEVYNSLLEIFPEVDLRALRAVAIEHNKDVDAAAEAVLTEIVPFLAKISRPPTSTGGNSSSSSVGADPSRRFTLNVNEIFTETSESEDEEQNASLLNDANAGDTDGAPCRFNLNVNEIFIETSESEDEEQNASLLNDANAGDTDRAPCRFNLNDNEIFIETSDSEDGEQNTSVMNDANAGDTDGDHVEVHGGFASEVAVQSENSPDENHVCASTHPAEGFVHAHIFPDTSAGEVHEPIDCETIMGDKKDESQGNLSAQDKLVSPERKGELVAADMISTESKYMEPNCSLNTESDKATISDIDIKDDSSLNTMVSRSNEICNAELLEGLISDARNNKKTLFSAMESVIGLMRKVELQEEAAQQAKEAASNGGFTILNTADELIKILQHAKEANDMRAGEVYGEKAVLATEARELQARLFSLSEERDKSLAILDEMHGYLLSRLAAAKEEEKTADKEKGEKEETARRSLAEQELAMEKVVQESNTLNQLAEENAKLQEFLEDRGHVMDSLQGEISIICQDVRVLRGKFDEHVLLSKSISSPQISPRLVPSCSSLKSFASDQVHEVPDRSDSSENLRKSELTTTKEQVLTTCQPTGNDKKALMEEGWEIFEDGDVYM